MKLLIVVELVATCNADVQEKNGRCNIPNVIRNTLDALFGKILEDGGNYALLVWGQRLLDHPCRFSGVLPFLHQGTVGTRRERSARTNL